MAPVAVVPYHASSRTFREELARLLPRDELKRLHQTSGWRHAAVVARQVAVLAAAAAAVLLWGDRWWVWVPASVVIGFVVFSFSVLLHEVVHRTVFRDRQSRWNRLVGLLYAVPSGLSATQFTRWHLDHHDWLGTSEQDPKRHHLTPKVVKRWYKALYLTPALFPIYFRAARREAATYPEAVRRTIRRERLAATAFHLALLGGLVAAFGLATALKLHAIPVFLVFPVAFTINRLGQHYDVVPDDPAKWGTLLAPSRFWDWVFLWSSHHLEHHYFPRVPFYRMPRLRRLLDGFYRARGFRERTYAGLLWDWFGRNAQPHADWSR
jgi:fatty acid desaturase